MQLPRVQLLRGREEEEEEEGERESGNKTGERE